MMYKIRNKYVGYQKLIIVECLETTLIECLITFVGSIFYWFDLSHVISKQKKIVSGLWSQQLPTQRREKRMNLTKLFSTNWSWTCQHKHVSVVKKNTKHNRLQKNTQTEHTDTVEAKKRKMKMKDMGFLSGVQKMLNRIYHFSINQVSLSLSLSLFDFLSYLLNPKALLLISMFLLLYNPAGCL